MKYNINHHINKKIQSTYRVDYFNVFNRLLKESLILTDYVALDVNETLIRQYAQYKQNPNY